MTVLVGISGKIGAGKNYLADRIIEKMRDAGYRVDYTSFAASLKNELNEIIAAHREYAAQHPGVTEDEIVELSSRFGIPSHQMRVLLGYFAAEVENDLTLDAYGRTPGIRAGLQYLGSDIRRAQKPTYWIDKMDESIGTDYDYLFATDTRFPNEADFVRSKKGVVLRLDVPKEVILSRTSTRDGLLYSEEALNHQSETALDDYENFDFYVGQTFDTQEIFEKIVALGKAKQA